MFARYWLLIKQILPPLPILCLATLPLDIGSSLVWAPAMIGSLISAMHLITAMAKWVLARLIPLINTYLIPVQIKPEYLAIQPLLLIRPILTLGCTYLAFYSLEYSYQAAIQFGRDTAQSIQADCRQQGFCPKTLANGNQYNAIKAGALAQYWLIYSSSPDLQTFQLIIRKNIDDSLNIQGGVNLPLAEKSYPDYSLK